MKYQDFISGMERFGALKKDVCLNTIGVSEKDICENVIIAPWWEPSALPDLGTAKYLSSSEVACTKVWEISNKDIRMTYIKTGIGAPVLMDDILALGVTNCKRIIFIGSVGSLDSNISIGDIVIPEYSVCGDGASRYISSDNLRNGDVFFEKAYPDLNLYNKIIKITERTCNNSNVKWHIARNFSTDTVFAQFVHLDEIIGSGCNVIEMETAAAFKAAKLANIAMTAVFSVSDNSVANKSLISGRTKEEQDYRRHTRRELFPKIILEFFK